MKNAIETGASYERMPKYDHFGGVSECFTAYSRSKMLTNWHFWSFFQRLCVGLGACDPKSSKTTWRRVRGLSR